MDVTVQGGLIGRMVDDRYLVESRIAEGGMATVYLAVDRRLDREVALKVMHTDLSDDQEYASRFVREARAAARLSHPNIVQVFDQGADHSEAGDDLLYLAMEYLPGRTLREVLNERGSLTPREAASVMVPLLDALAAAHRGGIVHRDVKPENIILTDDGRVKVADFGLAKAITAPISSENRDQLYGTAAYLAPELVSRGIADHRADLYAAGIVLFELLTGSQPFSGDDPLQVAHRHVHEQVPPPSEFAPVLPADFDALVLSATAHDPDRRPATAEEMLGQVRELRAQMSDAALDVRAATPDLQAPGRSDPTRALTDAMPESEMPGSGMPGSTMPGSTMPGSTMPGSTMPGSGMTATMAVPAPQPPTAVHPVAAGNGLGSPLPRLSVHEDDQEPSLVALGPSSPPREPMDERRKKIMIGTAAGVALVLILGLFWWFSGGPGSKIPAPAVVGLSQRAAEAELAKVGLSADVVTAFDNKVKKDNVISSDPAAGEGVKKDGTVTITVSKGPETVELPKVVGNPWSEVKPQLAQLGLTGVKGSTAYSSKVDDGDVISIDPKAGTPVKLDATVAVVVSKGPEPVEMPNVVGKNFNEAKQQLNNLGIKVKQEIVPFDGSQLPETVLEQSAAPGENVGKGDAVTLKTVDPNGQIQVPNVVNKTFKDAKDQLEGLGFTVQRVGGGFFGGDDDDQVTGQSPNPGEYKDPSQTTIYLQTQSQNGQ